MSLIKRVVLIGILVVLPNLVWANGTSVGFSDDGSRFEGGSRRETRLIEGALFASALLAHAKEIGNYNPTGFEGGSHSPAAKSAKLGDGVSSTVGSLQFETPKTRVSGSGAGLNVGATTVTVPEPGTLGLLGTGLLGIAGLIRRKLKSNPPNS